jgi:hypothetical protein
VLVVLALGFAAGLAASPPREALADAPACECRALEELARQARRQADALDRIADRGRP